MNNSKKTSALPAASTPLSGSEIVYVVQGGVSKKSTVSQVSQQYNTSNNCYCIKRVKISLTAADIKTAFSSPILALTPSSGSRFIQVLGGKINVPAFATPFTSSNITVNDSSGVIVGNFQIDLQTGNVADQRTFLKFVVDISADLMSTNLYISTDADSVVGDGTCDIYLTYIEQTI